MATLLTTAIAYTNGQPHIGHAFEWIVSDCANRWLKLRNGTSNRFLTGTDEHGQKIADTATSLNLKPKELCDKVSNEFKKLCSSLNIGYDRFIRTTDEDHKHVVYRILFQCRHDIYLSEYEGWYNQREETFVTRSVAEQQGFKDPVTGKPLVHYKEPSYFFRLSKYQQPLIDLITKDVKFIRPEFKRNEILLRLKEPLEDLSISRTTVEWGIPVPDFLHDDYYTDEHNHVLYVWFDALINYISGAITNTGTNTNADWNHFSNIVHVIGKDIVWFHSVIWPAMLMSAGERLPTSIVAHGFVCDATGQKMSKSVGNVVSPFDLLEKYPSDVIRSYIIGNFSLDNDFNFSERALVVYNDSKMLADLGNLINRSFGMFKRYNDCVVRGWNCKILFDVTSTVKYLGECIEHFKLQQYTERVFETIAIVNGYINETTVWTIGNPKFPKDERTVDERDFILRTIAESIYFIAHILIPIVPECSQKIFEFFNKPAIDLSDDNLDKFFSVFETFRGNDGHRVYCTNYILFTILDKEAALTRDKKNIDSAIAKNKIIKGSARFEK